MAFKLFAILLFVVAANAGVIQVPQQVNVEQQSSQYQYNAPQKHHVVLQKSHSTHEEYPYDPHPKYNFEYKVEDSVSGDSKSQFETRDGDVVQGEYSLTDADGFRRTVKYTADDVKGFNAVVLREPVSGHHSAHNAHVQAVPVKKNQHQYPAAAYVAPTSVIKAPVPFVTPTYSVPVNHHVYPEPSQQTYSSYAHQQGTHEFHHHQ